MSKSFIDFILPEDYERYNELLALAEEAKANAPKAPRAKRAPMTVEQKKKMAEYEKKSEEIFRRRFEREADRIISKVYNRNTMGASESKFMAASQKAMEELNSAQEEIASQTAMPSAKSRLIASQIIDKVTNAKKKEIK